MPRKVDQKFGTVNQRSFPVAVLDEQLQASLETQKEKRVICDFHFEKEILTLSRPWIEGQTQDELFRGLPDGERPKYSHRLFRIVQRKLVEKGCAHGALHPRNIILPKSSGFELVDAVFNLVQMNPRAVPQEEPWLWGPCLPKGWSLEDWDLVSLLRTAALLAQDPSVWSKPVPIEQAVEMCRKWADELIQFMPVGTDFLPVVDAAVKLLPAIRKAVFELPEPPLDKELDTLVARQGADRMLRRQDEDNLVAFAAKYGLGSEQVGQRLRTWMLLHDFHQEAELRHLAEELLRTGLNGQELISARACAAAERTFTHFGVNPNEASGLVQQLLAKEGWLDERRAADQCRQFLAKHFESSSELSEEKNAESLADHFTQESGFPPDVARRLVDLELERRLLGLSH